MNADGAVVEHRRVAAIQTEPADDALRNPSPGGAEPSPDAYVARAAREGCALVAFPALSWTGHLECGVSPLPATDPGLSDRMQDLADAHGLAIGMGVLDGDQDGYRWWAPGSMPVTTHARRSLPHPALRPGGPIAVADLGGLRVATIIGADIVGLDAADLAACTDADLIVVAGRQAVVPEGPIADDWTARFDDHLAAARFTVLLAGPRGHGSIDRRLSDLAHTSRRPVLYANAVGPVDGELRTGNSSVYAPDGTRTAWTERLWGAMVIRPVEVAARVMPVS